MEQQVHNHQTPQSSSEGSPKTKMKTKSELHRETEKAHASCLVVLNDNSLKQKKKKHWRPVTLLP